MDLKETLGVQTLGVGTTSDHHCKSLLETLFFASKANSKTNSKTKSNTNSKTTQTLFLH